MKKMIIFDLDGTLLNTLLDLHNSLNYALKKNGLNEIKLEDTKKFVGRGMLNLVKLASNDTNVEDVLKDFMINYQENNINETYIYDGINDVLDYLINNNYILSIISNKHIVPLKKIVNHYFNNKFNEIVGDGMGLEKKPSSDTFNYLLNKYNLNNDEILYIGDSDVDIKSIINMNIDGIIVSYGFRDYDDLKKIWNKNIIKKPIDLIEEIKKYA